MIFFDGKRVAEKIKMRLTHEVHARGRPPRLAIVSVGENPVSEKYIALKEAFARDIGAETRRYRFPLAVSTNQLRDKMRDIVHEVHNDGVIIQLPLPADIDTQSILNTVVPEKDVDVLSARSVGDWQVGKAKVRPPVVGAIEELFREYGIAIAGKKTALVGYGRLVGQPLAPWLLREGARLIVIGNADQFDPALIGEADIVISGAGKPKLITGDFVKKNAVVIDVGVSEVDGMLVGDVDIDSVKDKVSCMTPEKGGVGPVTVAVLFENLLEFLKARR